MSRRDKKNKNYNENFDKTSIYNKSDYENLENNNSSNFSDDDEFEDENKSSILKKVVIFLAVLVILIPVATFGYFYTKLNSMFDDTSLNDDTNLESAKDFNIKTENDIKNILLVGTDARPGETVSRSDAMMILTIDGKNKALKITSLNRDTYVDIPGYGKEKLTHAYSYGEAPLLIKTIEDNFKLDIQNYAVVNFLSFMDIIDTLGGVEVEVKQSEINETNKYIRKETYPWSDSNEPMELIEEAGVQTLNGYQALSFARIRLNDSTMERDRRQSEVIEGIINGVKDLKISKYDNLLNTILPHIKTNMTPSKIISAGMQTLSLLPNGITQVEFPLINMSTHTNSSGLGFVIKYPEESIDILHKYIFENIKPD